MSEDKKIVHRKAIGKNVSSELFGVEKVRFKNTFLVF